MVNFAHRHVYHAFFTLPDVNHGRWPSLPSGDFADEGDAVPFWDAMRHIYILFINGNDTLFCSEFNGEHAGEGFRLLRPIVLRYANVKLKKCRFFKKLTFDLSYLGQILA